MLDLGLPGMNGFEVAQMLKADPASAAFPIVVLTATDRAEEECNRLSGLVEVVLQKGDLSGAINSWRRCRRLRGKALEAQ